MHISNSRYPAISRCLHYLQSIKLIGSSFTFQPLWSQLSKKTTKSHSNQRYPTCDINNTLNWNRISTRIGSLIFINSHHQSQLIPINFHQFSSFLTRFTNSTEPCASTQPQLQPINNAPILRSREIKYSAPISRFIFNITRSNEKTLPTPNTSYLTPKQPSKSNRIITVSIP